MNLNIHLKNINKKKSTNINHLVLISIIFPSDNTLVLFAPPSFIFKKNMLESVDIISI